ncbi:unnamed protein product [Nippostrongylus brasiliensis]|uniref:Secreted protein n=1 Tax=Nippostrongylus brasiliensis TaxID=27835 RepID=A0A0N4Y7N2_NIPBR|nr:unnamed protein product [Nippostrongylus brasiliensis]
MFFWLTNMKFVLLVVPWITCFGFRVDKLPNPFVSHGVSPYPHQTAANSTTPPTLEGAVLFREAADELVVRIMAHTTDLPPKPPAEVHAPPDSHQSCLSLRPLDNGRPLLYQIVALKDHALILEAKHFFVFMPDHRESHCVLLDHFAFNVANSTYGYKRSTIDYTISSGSTIFCPRPEFHRPLRDLSTKLKYYGGWS